LERELTRAIFVKRELTRAIFAECELISAKLGNCLRETVRRMKRRDEMQERRYLLNIGQMLEGSGRDALCREAFDRIDRERRQKALLMKNVRAQAAGIGAGLLIQKALTDYMTECPEALGTECPTEPKLQCFSAEELLSSLDRKVTEPCYRYGKNGKPYLTDYPLQFNLSHSGDYVFCGVSGQEIGVDIQKIQGDNGLRLAKRFFADPERRALEACGDEELRRRMFFRMWVRKEAYGKLTGEGIAGTVGKCLWRDIPAGEELSAGTGENGVRQEDDLVWEEYDEPEGYRVAVCRYYSRLQNPAGNLCKNGIVKPPEL